jgi:hypothetical protein
LLLRRLPFNYYIARQGCYHNLDTLLERYFVEVLILLPLAALLWLFWQLKQAKRFTAFKRVLEQEIKPKLVSHIIQELEQTRSELLPNNQVHKKATIYYWCQYKGRILQGALDREIIDNQWLKDTGNWRNSQHLFHIEQHLLHK